MQYTENLFRLLYNSPKHAISIGIFSHHLLGFLTKGEVLYYLLSQNGPYSRNISESVAYYQTATLQHPFMQGNSNEASIITCKQVIWVLLSFIGSECSSILTYSILNPPPGAIQVSSAGDIQNSPTFKAYYHK